MTGELTLTTGRVYTSENSSATVNGTFFAGYFDFTLFVGCKTSLEGEYTSVSTSSIKCKSDEDVKTEALQDTVEVTRNDNIAIGEYSFDDWTFGAIGDCTEDAAEGPTGFVFTDVCGVVKFIGTTDEFGTEWSYSSEVMGKDWIITWKNPDSGLEGVTTITFKEDVPFTVE